MVTNDMVCGLPTLSLPKEICKGCLLSKQVRKSFLVQTDFTAKERLELVHGDLCGPISPPTLAGNRYFILLVDDYNRMMWVFMLKTKDEALGAFKRFKAIVEKGSKCEIKTFRTNRGGEFLSKEFEMYRESGGI